LVRVRVRPLTMLSAVLTRTRTSQGLRTVRTGYVYRPHLYQPPACCTYRRRRAACPEAPSTVRTPHAYQPPAYRTHRVPCVHHRLSAVPTPTASAADGSAGVPPPGRPQQQEQPEAPRRAPFGSGSARWSAAAPPDERAPLEPEPTRRRAPAFSFPPVSAWSSASAAGRQPTRHEAAGAGVGDAAGGGVGEEEEGEGEGWDDDYSHESYEAPAPQYHLVERRAIGGAFGRAPRLVMVTLTLTNPNPNPPPTHPGHHRSLLYRALCPDFCPLSTLLLLTPAKPTLSSIGVGRARAGPPELTLALSLAPTVTTLTLTRCRPSPSRPRPRPSHRARRRAAAAAPSSASSPR
jgi:hypothetical protein